MEGKDWTLTVEQLIKRLKEFNPKAKVLVSCDEELNTLYEGLDVTKLATGKDPSGEHTIVFFGLSGLEFEDEE